MRCSGCGTENPDRARFCLECARPFARRCSHCGAELPAAAKFCMECAQPVVGAAQPTIEVAPRAYTPPHLAEKILASRSVLEGERKQVTILFADVIGSTELIQGRDAEEAQALLDGVTRLMMDAVHRYEGTVSRLMGDGLMAMFGAPVAHEDHAVRACYAALAMQEAIRAYADEARTRYGVPAEVRAGLCSGEVVVRTINDDLHMDYTAMGQTVHLASRMEQLARAGTSLLPASTLSLVEGYVQVRSLGLVPVKGLETPVEVYELLGAGMARTRLQAAAARGLTRFVGRDAEMGTLYAALERAAGGRGQIAALLGEPGVGKSRLVWELTHSHRTEGWTVLESGSVSYGKATSYLPVIDLLKAYCRIESRDDARTVREKVAGKLLMLDRALEPTLPALLALLDVPVEDAAWDALDPGQRRRATLDAVKRVILRESQEQPLLVVFEDLHWIDSESQALLDGLVESLPGARILLLVNYRPEYSHSWGSRISYTQLRIDALAEEGAEALLAGLLGDDPSLEPLKRRLLVWTEGNPLFLEESVRSLVETGMLAGERGAYRLAGPVAETLVPATVQAVLAARIDRLPAEEKRLLQIAAVIGKDVPDALLHAIAERSEEELRRGLAGLQAAEFLYEASLFPELEYTFKHALTHEVAYGSLLQERRKMLHARVVKGIEELYADRLEEHVDRLAHHAVRGEIWEKVVTYCQQAGARAFRYAALSEALENFERALDALGHLPETRESQEQAIDIRLQLRPILQPLGKYQEALVHWQIAERLAEQLDDQRRLSHVYAAMTQYYRPLGRLDEGIVAGERALALARDVEDDDSRMSALWPLALSYGSRGDYRRARALQNEYLTLRTRSMVSWTPARASGFHGEHAHVLAELGMFPEATAHAEESVRFAQEDGSALALASGLFYLGTVYVYRGLAREAVEALEQSVESCEIAGYRGLFPGAGSRLAWAYALAGRADEAVPLAELAIERAAAIGRTGESTMRALALGEAYLGVGRWHDALEVANRALAFATAGGERGYEARARLLLGELVVRAGPPDPEAAASRFREALTLAQELEMRPLRAHCHLGLGKLYRRIGRADEARTELVAAVTLLREMGMAHWLPEAEAELVEVDLA